VVEQAAKARHAQRVVVATDDHRIYDAVRGFGGQAVMTSDSHQSGTDRIAEVMKRPEYAGVKIVVNVQGDEPEVDPGLIDSLIEALEGSEVPMATAAAPFAHEKDVALPNLVKVVTDQRRMALYFSRAVVPFDRERNGTVVGGDLRAYHKHLGIYAYRREALLKLAATPMCELERIEKLEQLRALYLGMKIFVHLAAKAPHGVDTPEDYAAFVKRYGKSHES
jgi:3-deoxy-manno-octulosonate cytidylyltransferase (CMP-KDO synthetase)